MTVCPAQLLQPHNQKKEVKSVKKNKTIFITGGASGIGASTVQYFFQKGWNVSFIDIDEPKAQTLIKSLGSPSEVSYFIADVREITALIQAVRNTIKTYGTIDTVFANAGVHHSANILSTSYELWQEIIDINLTGTFHTLKATLPELIHNNTGSIILMGSDQSIIAKKNSFTYGATKGAIGQLTKSLALDYAQNNIRVNCVCPSTIDTPLSRKALQNYADRSCEGNMEEVMVLEASEFPMGRIGQPDEVAKVVYFLASESASYITGTLLPIDGGYTAQ